jgi:CYTH domain-containing protein
MHGRGVEIERKFRLRTVPPVDELAARETDRWRVEQVYLRPLAGPYHRRIRRIEHADGRVEHVLTRKASMGDGTIARHEHEEPLSEADYGALLDDADPERRPIRKTRHVVPHGRHVLEVDVFEQPPGLVVVEVELDAVDDAVSLPPWLGAWREVTTDTRYLNAALARIGADVPPFPEDAG